LTKNVHFFLQRLNCGRGPSIYDVHTEGKWGSGSGGRMWTGGGVKLHVDVHTEN